MRMNVPYVQNVSNLKSVLREIETSMKNTSTLCNKALLRVNEIEEEMSTYSPQNVQGIVIARQNIQIKYLQAKETIQRLRTEIKILKGTIGAKRRAAREKAAVAGAKATEYVVPEDI